VIVILAMKHAKLKFLTLTLDNRRKRMTTGQFPKRRETERQKERRDQRAKDKEAERKKLGREMADVEIALSRPRYTASGRLTYGG
jgi:hypothetical protein